MAISKGSELRWTLVQAALMPAIGWALVLLVTLRAAFAGTPPSLTNVLLILLPGLAYIPAAGFAFKLRRAGSRDESGRLMRNALILAGIGLLLLIAAAVVIFGSSGP